MRQPLVGLPGVTLFCISDILAPTINLVVDTLSNVSEIHQTVQGRRLPDTQPDAMLFPPQNLDARRALLVKTKAAPSCHEDLRSSWTYWVSVSIPRRISTGLTASKTFSGVSMFERPENIGEPGFVIHQGGR